MSLTNIVDVLPDVNITARSIAPDIGISSNNTRCYIIISKFVLNVNPGLNGLHCFTSCDPAVVFMHKGKCRPLPLVQNEKGLFSE